MFGDADLALPIELALLGDALESLACALDTILVLVALGRQELYDLERAAGSETAERAGRIANILTDRVLVNL
jgi:hypothetical protein